MCRVSCKQQCTLASLLYANDYFSRYVGITQDRIRNKKATILSNHLEMYASNYVTPLTLDPVKKLTRESTVLANIRSATK